MRKRYLALTTLFAVLACAQSGYSDVTEQADILAPIFVNCPESTRYVGHCDPMTYTFKAVEPFTRMPSY